MDADSGRAPTRGGDRRWMTGRLAPASVLPFPTAHTRAVPRSTADRIRDVLVEGGPRLALQPIVNLRTWKVIGHEVLSRFPTGRPEGWFEDADEVGLRTELELLVLRNALEVLPTTPVDTFVSVNVSPDLLLHPRLLLELAVLHSSRLVLEVTEQAGLASEGAHIDALEGLRAAGARIAIDDVGAGSATLGRVVGFAPDMVKLDRSLVNGIDTDHTLRALLVTLVRFARKTGVLLIAEGVETDGEIEALLRLGVRYGQGFRVAAPMPVLQPKGPGTAAEWYGLPVLEPKYRSRRRRRTTIEAVAASFAISASASAATITSSIDDAPPTGATSTSTR